MQTKQFETIDLASLEQVAGGGRIGRKIKNALKNVVEKVSVFGGGLIDADFIPESGLGGFTVSE